MGRIFNLVQGGQVGTIVTVGLIVLGVLVLIALLRFRRIAKRVERMLGLIDEDQLHHARVIARSGGRPFGRFVEAVSGGPSAPVRTTFWLEATLLAIITLVAATLPAYLLFVLSRPPDAHTVLVVSALMVGAALLGPACLLAAVVIIDLRRRATRHIRRVTVAALSSIVRGTAKLEPGGDEA